MKNEEEALSMFFQAYQHYQDTCCHTGKAHFVVTISLEMKQANSITYAVARFVELAAIERLEHVDKQQASKAIYTSHQHLCDSFRYEQVYQRIGTSNSSPGGQETVMT